MKIVKRIVLFILLIVGALLIFGMFLPSKYKVERTVLINAPKESVWNQVVYYKNFNNWSYWYSLDSTAKTSVVGTDGQKGCKYTWDSKNGKVGSGEQTRGEIKPMEYIESHLHFTAPMESSSEGYTKLADSAGGIKVSYGVTGENSLISRIVVFFLGGMEKLVGPAFEKSMEKLKSICEYTVKNETIKSRYFATIRDIIPFTEINSNLYAKKYQKIGEYLGVHKLKMAGPVAALFYKWDMEKKSTDMAFAVPIGQKGPNSGDVIVIEIPETKYNIIDFYGDYSQTELAHNYMNYFVKKNKIELADGPVIEEYITDPMKEKNPMKWLTKISYPAKK